MNSDHHKIMRTLEKAKMRFITTESNEFLSNLLLSYQWEYDDKIDGLKTDGRTIRINPEHLAELNLDQQVGLLAHLSLNMGLNHPSRVAKLSLPEDIKLMNRACEIEANNLLTGYGFEIPPGTEQDYDGRYHEMPAERIYHKLLEEKRNQDDQGNGNGNGGGGNSSGGNQGNGQGDSPWSNHIDVPENAEVAEAIQQEIDENIGRAIISATMSGEKAAGMIPGNAQRAYDELLDPKQPWEVLLQDFMTGFDKSDYSMKRPNPSYFPDYIMPSLFGETLTKALVFIDVSGSITQQELDVFFTEIQAIRDQFPIEELHIVGFDGALTRVNILDQSTDISEVVLDGGGGTNIRPVINYIMEHEPQFAIVFTDGYFSPYEPPELETPILWLIHSNPNFETNIGEVVHHDV